MMTIQSIKVAIQVSSIDPDSAYRNYQTLKFTLSYLRVSPNLPTSCASSETSTRTTTVMWP